MSQMSEGGEGSTLIGTLSQIFSFFFFSDASPKGIHFVRVEDPYNLYSLFPLFFCGGGGEDQALSVIRDYF